MWAGVVPQHPPIRLTPASAKGFAKAANAGGDMSKTVSRPASRGIPALGLATRGTVARGFMAAIRGIMPSGPVEQLHPTASAPRLCSVMRAVTGSVPLSVRPSFS